MTKLSWKNYKAALEKTLVEAPPDDMPPPCPKDIKIDTRENMKGKWFLPLKGTHFDGHNFIEDAFKGGALGAFSEIKHKDKLPKELHNKIIFVTDCLCALQKIATYIREQNKETLVFAITGSIGKTSTKNLLASILEETGEKTLLAPKNFNNELGLPLTLLQLEKSHKYAVLEMGARKIGDITFLKKIAKPDINLCLCVGSSHIGTFGSKENIYQGKLEILERTVKEQKNLVLKDDPLLLEKALRIDSNCYTFGTKEGADAQLLDSKFLGKGKGQVTIKLFGRIFSATLATEHHGLMKNAAAASLLAFLGGVATQQIKSGLEKFYPTESRFKTIKKESFTLIDDSYNASLESMKAGIDSVLRAYPDKKVACFLGDMHDLGSFSETYHFQLAEFCLEKKLTCIVTVGEKTSEAFQKVFKESEKETKLLHFNSSEEFIDKAKNLEPFGEILYFKGAQCMNLKKIITYFLSL